MSDDRSPILIGGAPAADERKPSGRCIKCALIVPETQAFQRTGTPGNNGGDDGRWYHRIRKGKRDDIGEVCGPVAKALLFHVVAWANLNGSLTIMRRQLPTLQTPEENYNVVTMWEEAIMATFRAADQKGSLLVGFQPPPVVVSSWQHVGVSW